jgi:chromosome segregation ATPase
MPKNSNLRSRATSAILTHALFRFESAATIALTILLAYFVPRPFEWWQWWYWLVIGAIAEALIIYTSIQDVDTGAQVVSDMLREEFNPATIKTQKLRAAVERALDYRKRIEETIRKSEAGILQSHLQESMSGIADWIAQIFRLAQRLDAYERDAIIKQDAKSAPREIRELVERIAREDDDAVREQARHTLESKRAQAQNLEKLTNTMEQAELQLDATLTALGTVYSQLMLIRSKDDIQDSRAQRLRDDIADQVAKLNELQGAMDEVYRGKGDEETGRHGE